jgi:hypothetical protein
MSESDLITQSEAATLRGVSLASINDLVRRGRLRSVEQFGKRLVYRADVLSFAPSPGGWPKGKPRKKMAGKALKQTGTKK